MKRPLAKPLQKGALLLAAILLLVTQPSTTMAFDKALFDFYSTNNIGHIDGEAGKCAAGSGGGGAGTGKPILIGNSNAEMIWNFLTKDKKLKPNQAAGIMGNLRQESGENFDPNAREGNGVGYGIAQWSYGRRTALEAAAAKPGAGPVSDLAFQLQFLYDESMSRTAKEGDGTKWIVPTHTTIEWEVLAAQDSMEHALVFWHDSFERSGDSAEFVIKQRGGYANDALASFAKGDPSAGGGGAGGNSCSGSGGSAIQDLILKYAHPNYSASRTDMMPDYKEAVERAKGSGRYIGAGGIDCGAFVSILMYDSGFDKEYNYAGKGGNTVEQEKWLIANWSSAKPLGKGSEINVADLRPGDVAMWSEGGGEMGHTYVYAGDIEGFNSPTKIASASLNTRAPMAGTEDPTDAKFTWYRRK